MRHGVFGARADRRGLAVMCTEWARHMKPDRVLGIEVPQTSCDWSDYERVEVVPLRKLTDDVVKNFLDGLDVCYLAETDYNPNRPGSRYVTQIAKEVGCKLVLHAMPEMCRFAKGSTNRDRREPEPDLIVLPSSWLSERFDEPTILPFPVNRSLLAPSKRTAARRFLHVVGKPAMSDRAGTKIVEAARPQAEVVVHITQQQGSNRRAQVVDRASYHDIYRDFDVLLHPRRYGGQSLPLQEAASCAMPIIALDRIPERDWLPETSLIPVTSTLPKRMLGGSVEVAAADPVSLAEKIDELASSPALVADLSEASDELAQGWSWEVLGPRWRELLESVCA